MKFVISSSTFFARLQAVSKVISGKSVQPILDNILLESPFFMHSDIMKGGRIVVDMGNTPVKQ